MLKWIFKYVIWNATWKYVVYTARNMTQFIFLRQPGVEKNHTHYA